MSAGIQALAFSAPIIASNAIFASRRVGKGTNALDSDPVYGLINYDIAAGQTLKGVKAVENLAEISETSAKENIAKAVCTTEKVSKASKLGSGFMKVLNFTADHINPIIYASGVWKTVTADKDDRLSTGIEQATAIGSMRAGEIAYCKLAAMPYYKRNKETGVLEKKTRTSPLFTEAQEKALNDTLATKKLFNKISMKSLPHVAKGLGFVGTSIGFYALGEKIGKNITKNIKEKQADKTQANEIEFKPKYETNEQNISSKAA